jgi:pyridoxamine 5'-phosphate oxidase-like protein
MSNPTTDIDLRFGDPEAEPVDWETARGRLEVAELFWISTVRSDGRPHVTPLIGVWLGEAAYFCTGAAEQKAKNLECNPECVLMTGCNLLREGLDVCIEGTAQRVTDDERLRRIAAAYDEKYGSEWHFDVGEGAFHSGGQEAIVFEVAPRKVLGFGKDPYSQTRWAFDT